MKTHVLIVAVVLIHLLAIGSVFCIQGCGTRRTATVEPPPAPVMPPKHEQAVAPAPRPVFQPPVPIEPAPSMMIPTDGRTYTIQKGDSLSKVASRLGVSSRELAELNNIKDPNRIRVGQVLALPDDAKDSGVRAKAAPVAKKAEKRVVPEGASTYVVQAGDSLSKIAVKHGVKLAALREANSVSGDKILVGQKLVIPGAAAQPAAAKKKAAAPTPVMEAPKPVVPAPAPMTTPVTVAPIAAAPAVTAPVAEPKLAAQDQPLDYSAQEGDTVESVARLFVVRVEDVMSMNGITDPKMSLKVGQKIKIPPTEF